MLAPEYLEDLPEEILQLFYEVEQEILADMARRVSTYDYWLPAAEYQRQKLRDAGVLQEDILKSLSGITGRSEAELKRLMQEAGTKALQSDTAVYEAAGMTVQKIADSAPLRAILNAGYKATAQTMRNICKTTAHTATMQFENALDIAWLKVQSGAFDTDSAVRAAIKELSERGIQSIRYPSGRTDSIEVAVRRAVVTGVNQTAGQLQEELADELGCDLVEVSAHAGARPEHAKWQGKIYSRSGKDPKYPDFKKSTGYGTGAGLCGWNCRHTFGPYIEGGPPVWSEEQLAELDAPKYEYGGRKLTEYEASQQQRYNERQIRRWKREEAAMKATGLDSSEASAKVKEWQGRQQEFLAQTGFKRQYGREQIAVANFENRGIIDTRGMSMGLRKPASHILTDDEIASIFADADDLCISRSILRMNEGARTGFVDYKQVINIRGDILPDEDSTIARDRMSVKAVLAHEYYGHFLNHPSEYDFGDWRDEFRASYDAAIKAPNLSDEDRAYLMIDAYDRAHEAGEFAEYDEAARRIIYGY